MHAGAHVGVGGSHVHGAAHRGGGARGLGRGRRLAAVAHDHLPALLLRPPLEPVQLTLAVDAKRSQPHTGCRDELGRDGRRPRAVREVLLRAGLHGDKPRSTGERCEDGDARRWYAHPPGTNLVA